MSYSASLEYLFGLQKHGIKPGLDTIARLLDGLGRPQAAYPALHIGGTNGKGSTAAMAAAMLQAAGYRVGLYTSPHLVEFRERVRVNGTMIPEAAVAALTERVARLAGQGPQPTFFEFTTALAFQYFAEARVEVAVVEVGLGGRFDATNLIMPLASAITTVALDHQEYLGSSLDAIASEKAGIVKQDVPVVTGRLRLPAAEVVARTAMERHAPLYRLGREFEAQGDTLAGFTYRGIRGQQEGLTCPLAGAHQLDNAACALALMELVSERGLCVSEQAVRTGLRHMSWEGRLEVVERDPLLLLDGAHNPEAGAALAAYLASHRVARPGSRVILVLGMMRDKDLAGFCGLLAPLADELVLTQAQLTRAASVHELASVLGERAAGAHLAPHPAEALALARRLAVTDDLICVTGSLMLVGDVKALLRGCATSPIRG
jgi:dihydrofolate synthase/folylpolyglutamate synthase